MQAAVHQTAWLQPNAAPRGVTKPNLAAQLAMPGANVRMGIVEAPNASQLAVAAAPCVASEAFAQAFCLTSRNETAMSAPRSGPTREVGVSLPCVIPRSRQTTSCGDHAPTS